MNNLNFWHDKKVLITGAHGFIGSNLAAELVQLGAQVYALVNTGKTRNTVFLGIQDKLTDVIRADVCDYKDIARVFTDHYIDTCFHLAAQPIVGTGFESPLATFDVNIRGTTNILEAARCTPSLKRLVIASSAHVYGDNPNPPYHESFYPRPTHPYETSKACADMLAQTYHYTFGLPVAIARSTNAYGPGDLNFSRLIPKIMRSAVAGKNPEIIDGTSIRDYLYVHDLVLGYLRLGENLNRSEIQGEAFNFGSGQVLSAASMAQRVLDANECEGLNLEVRPAMNRAKIVSRQYVSTDKAKVLLGWSPQYNLQKCLRETYAWYKELSMMGLS